MMYVHEVCMHAHNNLFLLHLFNNCTLSTLTSTYGWSGVCVCVCVCVCVWVCESTCTCTYYTSVDNLCWLTVKAYQTMIVITSQKHILSILTIIESNMGQKLDTDSGHHSLLTTKKMRISVYTQTETSTYARFHHCAIHSGTPIYMYHVHS